MTARLVSVYRYFGKLVLVPFRYFSIDIYRYIDIFDNTMMHYLQVYLISPAAIKIGSLLSWLVMLSTENWEMLSQLLVWISGS